MILPFLELKEDVVDIDCFNCESIVSSDDVSDSYRIGLENIEKFIKSKENKSMIQTVLSEKD